MPFGNDLIVYSKCNFVHHLGFHQFEDGETKKWITTYYQRARSVFNVKLSYCALQLSVQNTSVGYSSFTLRRARRLSSSLCWKTTVGHDHIKNVQCSLHSVPFPCSTNIQRLRRGIIKICVFVSFFSVVHSYDIHLIRSFGRSVGLWTVLCSQWCQSRYDGCFHYWEHIFIAIIIEQYRNGDGWMTE